LSTYKNSFFLKIAHNADIDKVKGDKVLHHSLLIINHLFSSIRILRRIVAYNEKLLPTLFFLRVLKVKCACLERFPNTRLEGKGFFAEKQATWQRS